MDFEKEANGDNTSNGDSNEGNQATPRRNSLISRIRSVSNMSPIDAETEKAAIDEVLTTLEEFAVSNPNPTIEEGDEADSTTTSNKSATAAAADANGNVSAGGDIQGQTEIEVTPDPALALAEVEEGG